MTDKHAPVEVLMEEGIVAGNYYDKYAASSPIARFLMARFVAAVKDMVALSHAQEIHEVGCGEGHLSRILAKCGMRVRGSDFSSKVISKAVALSKDEYIGIPFKVASVYELSPPGDAAELVVCCEVFEHLESPESALNIVAQLANPYLLVSVPREPIWRILNVARGKYLGSLGNTPGHIQHWSRSSFLQFIGSRFEIVAVRTPLPWTVALCRIR